MKNPLSIIHYPLSIKYRFWLIVLVLVVLLTVLLLIRPEVDYAVLLVRNADGETAEIVISDLLKSEFGVRSSEISDIMSKQRIFNTEETEKTQSTQRKVLCDLCDFSHNLCVKNITLYSELQTPIFENYIRDKGDNLLKVFCIGNIIELTGFENQDFTYLRFDSADGASVLLQPQEDKDWLILLTLERDRDDLSLRLVLPHDNFSQRWLKNVVRITMDNG